MNTESKKTHVVIDLVYTEEEGNEVFEGSYKECHDWILNEQGMSFMYQVVPIINSESAR